MRWIAWLGLWLAGVGCSTPQDVCQDYEKAMNAMFDRCGLADRVMFTDPDGDPATCADVTQVEDPNAYYCECIPWTEEADCALVREGELHPACDASNLKTSRR